MDDELHGRQAFVSGSTAGIGFAAAAGLAQKGASVVVNGRTEERVADAVRKLREHISGADVQGVAADLSTAEGAALVTEQFPDIDVLVNNMGIFEPKAFADITDDDWRRFFDANVLSGVRLSRFYLPRMKRRDWGRIVFVSSESAVQIPAEMIHYGMTKTAQVAVSRGLAETTQGTNVTINAVLPGPTKSEGVGTFVRQMADAQHKSEADMETEFFQSARSSSLLQRFLTPEEVAHMIVYVCSPAASGTNGAALRVDGGVIRALL